MEQIEIKYEVNPSITEAKTLSAHFYLDSGAFEQSKEKIFSRCWQFVATRIRLVNQVGSRRFNFYPAWWTNLCYGPGINQAPIIVNQMWVPIAAIYWLKNLVAWMTYGVNTIAGAFIWTENSCRCPSSRRWRIFLQLQMICICCPCIISINGYSPVWKKNWMQVNFSERWASELVGWISVKSLPFPVWFIIHNWELRTDNWKLSFLFFS